MIQISLILHKMTITNTNTIQFRNSSRIHSFEYVNHIFPYSFKKSHTINDDVWKRQLLENQ